MSHFNISKQQTNLLKGVGILLIVLHNYFHWIAPFTGENEFIFNATYTHNFLDALTKNIAEIPNTLLSFFGHYGVQLFIFISGYGLAKSYLKKEKDYYKFIKHRVLKIYPAFIIGVVVLFMYTLVAYSTLPSINWCAKIALKLSMMHTLVPKQALSINGPWWFYGLIFQLYILFIPLFYVIKRWEWKGFLSLLLLSYIIVFLVYTPLLEFDVFILANAPGHIPEFTMGIALALFPGFKVKWWVALLLGVLFVLGNFYFPFFPFTFLAISYLMFLGIIKAFRKETLISRFVQFYGKLSMFLFAIHGFFRKPYFIETAKNTDNAIEKFAIGLLYLVTVTVVAIICKELYSKARKVFALNK